MKCGKFINKHNWKYVGLHYEPVTPGVLTYWMWECSKCNERNADAKLRRIASISKELEEHWATGCKYCIKNGNFEPILRDGFLE